MRVKTLLIAALLFLLTPDPSLARTEYRYAPAKKSPAGTGTVIGRLLVHTVKPGETLLDIARRYGLGVTELQAVHPDKDPWLLEEGSALQIPTLWIVPPTRHKGIVINVPEMRLYRYHAKRGTVSTYAVTVGEEETQTPLGTFRVVEKEEDPEWNIPRKLQHKYNTKVMPAGPDNPIGRYWLGLSARGYGIHGTDNPWSVGRILSNGCIRLYPEDIERLYPDVPKGTVVEILYEPVKFGLRGSTIYVEVHGDPYGFIGDMGQHARLVARKQGIEAYADWEKIDEAIEAKNGVPVPVGTLPKGGDGRKLSRR
ncbi:MAG: L,D-transpeptidase family protein [Syntrophaceae bacterium]|nr:L,D-transpeptidase family protein [Syntrophaceae bacterium]